MIINLVNLGGSYFEEFKSHYSSETYIDFSMVTLEWDYDLTCAKFPYIFLSYNNVDINTDFKHFKNSKSDFLQNSLVSTEILDFCNIQTSNELKFQLQLITQPDTILSLFNIYGDRVNNKAMFYNY